MKKAISFSGQSRFIKEGFESLKANLKNFNEYDIFIHTWSGVKNAECELYNPKGIVIEPQLQVVPPEFNQLHSSIFTHFSMFYSMAKSMMLKYEYENRNNFKYDLIIRTRFDISLESKLDPEAFDLSKGIYSPDVCGNPAVISDWFNFGNWKNMNAYEGLYSKIPRFHKENVMITSGEEIITYALKELNIPIVKIPCNLYLLRDRNIHKTLSSYWKYAN